jgi:hypothetical protein
VPASSKEGGRLNGLAAVLDLPPERRPIFLVGAQRSGSTLLRLMIDAHPQVAFPRHTEVELAAFALSRGERRPPDVEAYVRRLQRSRRFKKHGNTIDPALSVEELASDFLRQSASRAGKPWVGAVVHKGFGVLPAVWPHAFYVYLVRDPRGVAASILDHGWAANAWTAVDAWVGTEETWRRLRPRLDRDRFCEVRFEDLVADPRATLTRICEMLGVPYSDDMLRYTETSDYGAPNPAIAARWRDRLARWEVAIVEHRTGRRLVESGYARVTGDRRWPALVGPAARAHEGAERAVFRLRRYGPRLTFALVAARALGRSRRIEDVLDRIDRHRRSFGKDRHRIVRASIGRAAR